MNGINRATDLFERFVERGETTIDEFISEEISEELFVDYKRVTKEGASPMLEQPDRENFARAISGFGNSEGGIVIWGVDCRNDPQRGDVPTTKHPIRNVKRFLSHLEGTTSGCTIPPHDGVRHHLIERKGSDEGFVVTLISKSMFAPHQCVVGKHRGRYHVRVGSNFEQAPHGLLAGMFGRRPAPYVFNMWQIGGGVSPSADPLVPRPYPHSTTFVRAEFVLRNHGIALAQNCYVNYSFRLPGSACLLHAPNIPDWIHSKSMLDWNHIIAPDGYRLPPGGMVKAVRFNLFLKPPFEKHFWYELSFGCEGSQVFRIVRTTSTDDIASAYSAFMGSDRGPAAGRLLARAVLGIDEQTEYKKGFEDEDA